MKKPTPQTVYPRGQVRRSQLLNTFGPGSLIDLPEHSVLVGGLDHWRGSGVLLDEPRLLEKIRRFLPDIHELRQPPIDPDSTTSTTGVTVWQFPEWFITQDFVQGRARRLVHRTLVDKGKIEDEANKKKKHPVVPVRFVRACPKGHIGDIDWSGFVHEGEPKKPQCRTLWMEEQGSSGDLARLWVRCSCGKSRSMSAASVPKYKALGLCDGNRPWLGRAAAREECDEFNRLLIRSASHAYFSQLLSVISLPLEQDDPLRDVVAAVWDTVAEAASVDDVDFFRCKVSKVRDAAAGYDSGQLFNAIRARRDAVDASSHPDVTVKDAELEVLTAKTDPIGRDHPDSVFYARALTSTPPAPIDRVLQIHRLREVVAQVGFTRFEAVAPAARRRQPGRRNLHWFSAEGDSGMAPAAGRDPAPSATLARLQGVAGRTPKKPARISRCRLSAAAYPVAPAADRDCSGLRLSRQCDP